MDFEFLGYIAAFLTTTAFFPQAYAVYKTRHTKDLSLGLFLLISIGMFLWLLYGLAIKSYPVIIANFISFIAAFYILIMKIKLDYLNKSKH